MFHKLTRNLPLYKVGDQTYSDEYEARVEAARLNLPYTKTQLCLDIEKQRAALLRVKKEKAQIRKEKWHKLCSKIKRSLDSLSKNISVPQPKTVKKKKDNTKKQDLGDTFFQ